MMDRCEYCGVETDGYIELGRGERLLKVVCCEECYRTAIEPLPQYRKDIMAEAAHILAWRDIPCNFK